MVDDPPREGPLEESLPPEDEVTQEFVLGQKYKLLVSIAEPYCSYMDGIYFGLFDRMRLFVSGSSADKVKVYSTPFHPQMGPLKTRSSEPGARAITQFHEGVYLYGKSRGKRRKVEFEPRAVLRIARKLRGEKLDSAQRDHWWNAFSE